MPVVFGGFATAVLVMRQKVPVPRLPPGSFAQGQTGAAGAEHFSQKVRERFGVGGGVNGDGFGEGVGGDQQRQEGG